MASASNNPNEEKKEAKAAVIFNKNLWPLLWQNADNKPLPLSESEKEASWFDIDIKEAMSVAELIIKNKDSCKCIAVKKDIYYIYDGHATISAHIACGKKVGHIELDANIEWLDQIEVDSRYRRLGIGTTLITLAREEFGDFNIADVDESFHDNHCYSLTPAGRALIQSCINKGILSEAQMMPPEEVPRNIDSTEADEGSSSPACE
ncbi:MAG: hypothetical protein M1561_03930 [Gammaproteobacteria bacterium]|nr:hypothetical protein [Gammaproteobacteria bacterium]